MNDPTQEGSPPKWEPFPADIVYIGISVSAYLLVGGLEIWFAPVPEKSSSIRWMVLVLPLNALLYYGVWQGRRWAFWLTLAANLLLCVMPSAPPTTETIQLPSGVEVLLMVSLLADVIYPILRLNGLGPKPR